MKEAKETVFMIDTVLFVMYDVWLKQRWSFEHMIQKSVTRWQHSAWLLQ
jgi:hypothetical protein